MAGRGRAYREKRRKTLVAPSGDEFVIRKPGAKTYTRQFKGYREPSDLPEDIEYALTDEGMRESAREALSERSSDELIASMDALIIECVVNPKVVEHETDNDDELWIEEIEMGDYFFLFTEITEFAGVTPEKLRELFRDLGRAGGSTGGDDSNPVGPET